MLFNSYIFIFLFVPVVYAVFSVTRGRSRAGALYWLLVASLFFYAWWDWRFLPVLVLSILGNFAVARAIASLPTIGRQTSRRWLFIIGVSSNLAVLAYFKYAGFLSENLRLLLPLDLDLSDIVLPIGISFFTFQQIAFLCDVYYRRTAQYEIGRYSLFVSFFPQLIAGPIVHHRDVMGQFARRLSSPRRRSFFAAGLALFLLGLFKKVVVADHVAQWANAAFAAAGEGRSLAFADAWTGALAYTFQIYFDFCAYSEMAIGLGLLFGIRLPLNFDAPYRATSIIDFWRRWHMTLSRFLRDYVYIPLGGSRHGRLRRHVNLMATMALGGLWHGAAWTFVLWGVLHGLYLMINHAWRSVAGRFPRGKRKSLLRTWAARVLTFAAVVFAWVLFRASSLEVALSIIRSMLGLNGVSVDPRVVSALGPAGEWLLAFGVDTDPWVVARAESGVWIAGLLMVVWFAPSVSRMFGLRELTEVRPDETATSVPVPTMHRGLAVLAGLAGAYAIANLSRPSEFIYFQF